MSQQINLLKRKTNPRGPAIWAVAVVGAVLLGLLAYLQLLSAETSRLRETADIGEQKLAQVRSSIQALQKQRNPGDEAALRAEIAALRSRAEIADQLTREVRSGNLGSPDGFARYFTALGAVTEPGVWVTSVVVSKGGGAVNITGRALRNESVMQYVRRLNESFSPYGVRFNSLELTPDKPGTPGAPAVTSVAFKLS